jgi:copper chaperone CopZ
MNIKLSGLTCAACAKLASKRIGRIPGVSAVQVDKDSGRTDIVAVRVITLAEINESLKDTAYRAQLN